MKFQRARRVFDAAWDVASVALLVTIFVSIFLQVLMRYVFNAPLAWTEEISRFSFIWLAMIGSVGTMRDLRHLRVDLLQRVKNQKFQNALEIFDLAVTGAVLVVIVYWGCRQALKNIHYFSNVSKINMGFLYAAIPIGALGMLIYALINRRVGK